MPNENSRALPLFYYRDPALVAESNELHFLGCRACDSHHHLLGRVICAEPRKTNYKDVPRIGSKCKFFKEKASQC